jgi:antitoxin HicB
MTDLHYPIIVEEVGNGVGFIVQVPDLPGCTSQGDTREEAIENAHHAIAAWIEKAGQKGWTIPAV